MGRGEGTARAWFRVGYWVRGRNGRHGVDAMVSELVPFDLPVRDAADAPVVVRVDRLVNYDDFSGLEAMGIFEDMQGVPPRQVLDFRSDGEGLLRPMTAIGGQEAVAVADTATLTERLRGHDPIAAYPGPRPLNPWTHYPTESETCPSPWQLPDRGGLVVTRVDVDGRDGAMAEAGRALGGACVIDGIVWVRSAAPVLSTPYQFDAFDEEVEVPGYDYRVPDDRAAWDGIQRMRAEAPALALRNVREDVAGGHFTVTVLGPVPTSDLDAINLTLLAGAVRRRSSDMSFRASDPETRHAMTGLDLALDRHVRGVAGVAETFPRVMACVAALAACDVAHPVVADVLAICGAWEGVAVRERDDALQAGRALEAAEEEVVAAFGP